MDDCPLQSGDVGILCDAMQSCMFTFMLHDLKWYERIYWRIRGYEVYSKHIDDVCAKYDKGDNLQLDN